MATESELKALKKRYSRTLLAHPCVSGVGVERADDGTLALTVHLNDEAPDLPSELDGHAVRYVRRGRYTKR
jgi:hypothetical protein